jgi:hypothetical protein
MRLSRWFTGAVVVAAASFLSSDSVGAQSVAQSQPVLKPAKERGTKPPELETLVSEQTNNQRRLSLCIDSWDAETHMSKQEWRVACQRSVRDYPDAFFR